MALSRIAKSCMDIVLPPGCAVCNLRIPCEGYGNFCDRCGAGIRYLAPPFCRICGIELFGVADFFLQQVKVLISGNYETVSPWF
jgi:hypothetical protein